MMGREHGIFGVAVGTAAMVFAGTKGVDAAAFVGMSFLGSLLPDADHEHSTIANMVFPLRIVHHIVKQRTYLHDFVFWAIVAGVMGVMVYFGAPMWVFGLILGVASHLFLDALTYDGVPVFYLLNKKSAHIFPYGMRIPASSKRAIVVTWMFTILLLGAAVFWKYEGAEMVAEFLDGIK